MASIDHNPDEKRRSWLDPARRRAFLFALMILALTNVWFHLGEGRLSPAILYATGRSVGGVLLVMGVAALFPQKLFTSKRRAYATFGALTVALSLAVVPTDLREFIVAQLPDGENWVWPGAILIGLSVPAVAALARWLARPVWRWLGVMGGTAAVIGNAFVLQDGYEGPHLMLAFVGVTAIVASLGNCPEPAGYRRFARAAPWAVAAVAAVATIIVSPTSSTNIRLLTNRTDVVSPYLVRFGPKPDDVEGAVPKSWKPWFDDRTQQPPTPATKPWLPPDSVVILLTIDSLRADIFNTHVPANAETFKSLQKLRSEGTNFTLARAPGSQTVYTIAQFFMGTYFSQQYWSRHPGGRNQWPDDDETTRFTELLSGSGVTTVNVATAKWLVNEFGVVRGFNEETFVAPPKEKRFSITEDTVPHIVERLGDYERGSLFIYSHILDTHFTASPVKQGRGRNLFLANLAAVDENIGTLLAKIEELGLDDKTWIVISSDHGEAFGQHGAKRHAANLYEELVRVPLLFWGPQIKKRSVSTPVTLMDLGPTFLNMYGLKTPSYFMGESLLPLLQGKTSTFTRPIVAEGRLKKSLVWEDGIKVVVDDHNMTTEVYDLLADPGETLNLFDTAMLKHRSKVSLLRQFFRTHTIQREGYRPIFRK